MRPIKKDLAVTTVKYLVYDSVEKKEEEIFRQEIDGEVDTGFRYGVHVLEKTIISTQLATFTMDAKTFIEYATQVKASEDNDEEHINE